jgi:hypothetical protein
MKFDLSKDFDKNKAESRLKSLIEKGAKCELTEIRGKRTHSQNKYIHVLFGLFGIEFGLTLEEAKTHLKRNCNFMVYEKGSEKFLAHTSDLDTKGLTNFIDWIREYSGKQGCYLPTPTEYREQFIYFDNEINKSKSYL